MKLFSMYFPHRTRREGCFKRELSRTLGICSGRSTTFQFVEFANECLPIKFIERKGGQFIFLQPFVIAGDKKEMFKFANDQSAIFYSLSLSLR